MGNYDIVPFEPIVPREIKRGGTTICLFPNADGDVRVCEKDGGLHAAWKIRTASNGFVVYGEHTVDVSGIGKPDFNVSQFIEEGGKLFEYAEDAIESAIGFVLDAVRREEEQQGRAKAFSASTSRRAANLREAIAELQ